MRGSARCPLKKKLLDPTKDVGYPMDGFCNQNADLLGSLAGLSFPVVYVGVVECAPASPYTYSSSTHRFPDERTRIEATPLSATSAELGLGLGLGSSCSYTYSSSTHRFPDERTPIEATPLSATSVELGLGFGSHFSSHAPSHVPLLLLATLLSHNIPLPRVH